MFQFFFEERKKQLQSQIKIDSILQNIKDDCSDTVSEYLFFQREFTRNQQFRVMESSIFHIKKEVDNQLKMTNALEQIFLEEMTFPSCQKLKELIFLSKDKIKC